jgi:hypothetical protein
VTSLKKSAKMFHIVMLFVFNRHFLCGVNSVLQGQRVYNVP